MNKELAKEKLQQMRGRRFTINGKVETFQAFIIHDKTGKITLDTNKRTDNTTLDELEEFLEKWKPVADDSKTISIKETFEKENTAGALQLFDKINGNSAMQKIEEALLENMAALRKGEEGAIDTAYAMNDTATTFINMQKTKIEMGRLMLEAKRMGE